VRAKNIAAGMIIANDTVSIHCGEMSGCSQTGDAMAAQTAAMAVHSIRDTGRIASHYLRVIFWTRRFPISPT